MLGGAQLMRMVIAWLLATVTTTLAFTRGMTADSRAVFEFLVMLIFNLALTALAAFAAYSASRWFVVWERPGDQEELALERVTIIMVTLAVASLGSYLFAFE